MSRLLKFINHEKTGRFLATLLMAFGLSCVCCTGFFPAPNIARLFLWCLLFSAFFAAYSQIRLRFKGLIAFSVLAGLAALGIFMQTGPAFAAMEAVKAFLYLNSGWTEILSVYANQMIPFLCLLLTLTAWGAAADESCFSTALYVIVTCVILFLMAPIPKMLLFALPAFAGLALQLSRKQRFNILALPIAALLVALAFLLTPESPATSKPLQEMAKDIRTAIEDHLLYTEQRTSFSLKTEGYQPLDTRLGGKPNPSDAEVMDVETDETLLLRGKTYDFYTGISWEDSLSSKRYLYHSMYNKQLRTTLFGQDMPLTGTDDIVIKTASVQLKNNGTTTLFAPSLLQNIQLQGQRMVLYFNTAGELFLTRETAPLDRYSVSYLPLHAGHAKTAEVVNACASLEDPYFDTVLSQYLTLPSHIQQEVYDIAAKAVDENATPYEKALQLQSYLQKNYPFSLDVETPPENVDFTAYFLLGEKKGYCTYFATAMTVLCRINGIPARYVTGYLAQPGDDGIAHVTGMDAHAWTEIYLKGFGWLPVDATGFADTPEQQNSPSPSTPPTPTPTPPPSPTPAPSPSASPAPSAQPSPTPPPQMESPSPAPSCVPTPSPNPSHAPLDGKDDSKSSFWPWLLLLLLMAALALRYYVTLPQTIAGRRKADPFDVYFAAVETALNLTQIKRHPAMTLHQFAEQAAQMGYPEAGMAIVQYAAHLYGQEKGEYALLQSQYQLLFKGLSPIKKMRFRLKWMFSKHKNGYHSL